MTQADLAIKLNVTDKAVSRWERGIGFPDINTIEPLASALEISVLELMKSERIISNEVTKEEATDVITDTLNVVKQQRRQERKNVLCILGVIAVVVILVCGEILWASERTDGKVRAGAGRKQEQDAGK